MKSYIAHDKCTGAVYGGGRAACLHWAFEHVKHYQQSVWKLDRLGRNVKDLFSLVGQLENQGIHFKSLTDNIDTSTTSGRFFFHIMASLAQMERELLVERTHAGLEAARKRGRVGGRKRKMTDSKLAAAKRLLADGVPPKDVAMDLGISIPTLYRWLPASQRK